MRGLLGSLIGDPKRPRGRAPTSSPIFLARGPHASAFVGQDCKGGDRDGYLDDHRADRQDIDG